VTVAGRHKVLALAVSLAFITYLDRVCISVTAPAIMRELSLTPVEMSFIFSAFTIAYAIFETPTGWWGDRVGPRRVLTRIVVWWSVFTMATATATGFRSLAALRFLFGMGEAGAWPNVAKALARWFPSNERGTAQGIFFMGAHLGGGVTPLLVALLSRHLGWRGVFVVFSLFGFAWAAVWRIWFRDDPAEHRAVSAAELEHIRAGTTIAERGHGSAFRMLANPSVILICGAYFTQSYGFYFYITWLPTYLQQTKGVGAGLMPLLAGLPLLLSVLADLLGGLTSDRLTRRYGFRVGRCGVAGASLAVAAVAIGAATLSSHSIFSACLIALGAASSNFLLGASWSACVEIAGRNAGFVSAAMNTAGQIGGTLSPIVFAWVTESWDSVYALGIIGGLYFAGAVCWVWVKDPGSGQYRLDDLAGDIG
jgi:MFS transporter, ACS family, glucarate transporter